MIEGAVCASFEALGREPPAAAVPAAALVGGGASLRLRQAGSPLRPGDPRRHRSDPRRRSSASSRVPTAVRQLTVPKELSRGGARPAEEYAKSFGAKGLAYLVFGEDGEVRSPIAKFLSDTELDAVRPEPGSTVLFGADEPAAVERALGALRLHLGRELGLVDETRDEFLWVTDFPLFEWSEDDGGWHAAHHPFTGLRPGDEHLLETDPGAAVSQAYDLVWNGWELGSGSIRIHRQELQQQVFRALGISDEDAERRFGFLLEVLRMGAPPHGGFALGLDRFLALMAGEPNIRQVIAFPKAASGSEPMTGAPTPVAADQLRELGVQVIVPTD